MLYIYFFFLWRCCFFNAAILQYVIDRRHAFKFIYPVILPCALTGNLGVGVEGGGIIVFFGTFICMHTVGDLLAALGELRWCDMLIGAGRGCCSLSLQDLVQFLLPGLNLVSDFWRWDLYMHQFFFSYATLSILFMQFKRHIADYFTCQHMKSNWYVFHIYIIVAHAIVDVFLRHSKSLLFVSLTLLKSVSWK